MPITRSRFDQTSFEKKMRGYLAAHAAKQHERQFGWKNFRVLTITTTDEQPNAVHEGSVARIPRSSWISVRRYSCSLSLMNCAPAIRSLTDGLTGPAKPASTLSA